ncbi:MAG: hypothetical protein KDC26_10660 [Armatimonadetes bacterium]|nr:hypothetical protein [Armatimonadota bacterium]
MKTWLLSLAVLAPIAAHAQEVTPVDIDFDLTYSSKYVWRGVALNNQGVWQPSLTLSSDSWFFNLWGNFDWTNSNGMSRRFTEFDYTFGYQLPSNGGNAISIGATIYQFPGSASSDTTELWLSYALGGSYGASIDVYKDIDVNKGFYVSVSGSHPLTMADPTSSLSLDASLGWGDKKFNNFTYGNNKGAFADYFVGLSWAKSMDDNLSLHAALGATGFLDKNQLAGQPNRSNLTFSFGAGWRF